MSRRRITLVAGLVLLAIAASRCDRRSPGPAAPTGDAETLEGGVTRLDLRFPCSGSECAGWLYRPAATDRPPVAIMAGGFAGTRDVGLSAVAERLARAGIAAFAFDYRYFGASGGRPRQLVDPWEQLADWRAALAFVRARPDLDAKRLALWGTSLGAGHALIVASEDGGIRAVVGQAPLVDSGAEGEATFYGMGWVARLLVSGWADLLLSVVDRGPLLVPAIAPGHTFGMIQDDAAHAAFSRLVAPESTYRNAVAARSILTFDDYDPRPHAERVAVPILLIASPADRFAPFAAVEGLARGRDHVTIERFPGDHFDVYSPPAVEIAADAATRFLGAALRTP